MGRHREPGPAMKYLGGEDGNLCPICGKNYIAGQYVADGCVHGLSDLETFTASKPPTLPE